MADHTGLLWVLSLTDAERATLTEAVDYMRKRYWGTGERAAYSALIVKLNQASPTNPEEPAT